MGNQYVQRCPCGVDGIDLRKTGIGLVIGVGSKPTTWVHMSYCSEECRDTYARGAHMRALRIAGIGGSSPEAASFNEAAEAAKWAAEKRKEADRLERERKLHRGDYRYDDDDYYRRSRRGFF